MTTILNSLNRIGTSQFGMAARFGTLFVDALDRVVAVQTEAANSAFHEGVKNSQALLGRDMLASPAEWPNWYAEWIRSLATNNSRLAQETARKLHEATLQTHAELHQIAAEQMQAFTKDAKARIERIREESSTLLAGFVPDSSSERRADEVASAVERPAKKAA